MVCLVAAGLLVGPPARASAGGDPAAAPELLNPLFQEHAVLQRDVPITVWGHAASGEGLTISLAGASVHARADSSGRWSAALPPMSNGGPFTLTAQSDSGTRQAANDIFVGDVFLCSGQSNMEMPVERAGDAGNEIENSANNTIRMLTVAHSASPAPLSAFEHPVAWQVAGPHSAGSWSAACFYFARELQKTTHVPLGLVHSSWGGSNIRPWISAAGFRALGGYDTALQTLALYAQDQAGAQAQFASQWENWWRAKTGDRVGREPWSAHSVRDMQGAWRDAPRGLGDWRDWGVAGLRDFTGLVWFRTHIKLTAAQAKAANRLDLGAINQVDETWLNGRPVGNTFGYGTDRSYALAPGLLQAGDNVLVINVLSTYGGGGLRNGGAKRALYLTGGESIPLDGPWQYRVVPATVGYPPRAPWESTGGDTTLYNAMIAPLGSFGFRGVLWYQGESNADEASTYRGLLTELMADWRRQFGAGLPFLVVQLPNWGRPQTAPGEDSNWAALREAQRQAVANDAHAGLAVTLDIGEPGNLHPTNKQDVGKRLAQAARHVIYSEAVPPSGPTELAATRKGNQVVVEFGGISGGLVAYSHSSPIGFELCGDTPQSCRFADARMDGTKVVLTVPQGEPPPTHVRYGWADSPVCTLFDRSGLPAGPFNVAIEENGGV
jgi:sialate O-acetylesterase